MYFRVFARKVRDSGVSPQSNECNGSDGGFNNGWFHLHNGSTISASLRKTSMHHNTRKQLALAQCKRLDASSNHCCNRIKTLLYSNQHFKNLFLLVKNYQLFDLLFATIDDFALQIEPFHGLSHFALVIEKLDVEPYQRGALHGQVLVLIHSFNSQCFVSCLHHGFVRKDSESRERSWSPHC